MRIVCISDTHGLHEYLHLPAADILIHAGDMCNTGRSINEVTKYATWLATHSHKYKKIIQIAGNHDWQFENTRLLAEEILCNNVSNLVYLHDSEYIFDGIKFYGYPWQPEFCNWAFNLKRGSDKMQAVVGAIPDDVDVLVTHGPPYGTLDFVYYDKMNVGCLDLSKRLDEVVPMVHVFGHIHETYGVAMRGETMCVNPSICNLGYDPINKPIVLEIEKSEGQTNVRHIQEEKGTSGTGNT